MNAVIVVNGVDVTDVCRLQDTRINYDSSRRIATANITIMGRTLARVARYDYAHYDEDNYGVGLQELYQVTILDGRDRVTKLFDGQIFAMSLDQSDAPTFELFYKTELNDWASWLDRSVCWDSSYTLPLPASDQDIIVALLGRFCPRIALSDVAECVPEIQNYDWRNKTCRQVLDDMAALAMADWRVDFDAGLHYGFPSAAAPAPFALSTSPDFVNTFPVRVNGYRHDFTNPVNRAYVRGAWDLNSATLIEASYADPVSIQQYGEYQSSVVNDAITTAYDAALLAKSTVLKYAYPIEQGSFTIWKDGLRVGHRVQIHEDNLGVDGEYTIRALTMAWETPELVRYEAQFGAAQPDLETILRTLDQRTKWKSTAMAVSTPKPGSVTDASIAPGGLSALVINSVSAGAIVGAITGEQIGYVNAHSIAGAIVADQIGGVYATTIQGVVVANQLADKIIDDLAKYADALRPVPMVDAPPVLPNDNYPPNAYFYNNADGHFYRINAAGTGYTRDDNPQNALMKFYHIGAISARDITGLIVAAQIQTITAGQITGQIQAGQIQTVNASSISGQITAGQIASVNATAIQGTINNTQIGTITAGQISGTLSYNQIGSVNAATITIGAINDNQIGTVSGGKIIAGTVTSDKMATNELAVGGGGNKPGVINVYDAASGNVAQIGNMAGGYGGWFKVFGAGGTGYADAKVKTDTGGSLTIKDATLSITGGASTLSTGPSTFDASYSTLTLNNADSTDRAAHISRGMVFYYNSAKIGSLVRSPQGGYLTLECTTYSNGAYVLISGADTGVRSDAGYMVGSARVIDSAGTFRGAGALCPNNGIGALGFNPWNGTQYLTGVTGSFVAGTKTITVTGGVITSIA